MDTQPLVFGQAATRALGGRYRDGFTFLNFLSRLLLRGLLLSSSAVVIVAPVVGGRFLNVKGGSIMHAAALCCCTINAAPIAPPVSPPRKS
jgi:hypothetical protein